MMDRLGVQFLSEGLSVAGGAPCGYLGVDQEASAGDGSEPIITLTHAGIPESNALSSAGRSRLPGRDVLAVRARRLRRQVVTDG